MIALVARATVLVYKRSYVRSAGIWRAMSVISSHVNSNYFPILAPNPIREPRHQGSSTLSTFRLIAGSTLNHWPFPGSHLEEGYAYLLMHPGTPCVFYDHFWDQGALGQAVRKLLKVRRTNGIHARSKVHRPGDMLSSASQRRLILHHCDVIAALRADESDVVNRQRI